LITFLCQMMSYATCVEFNQKPPGRCFLTICGHLFCSHCWNARLPDENSKYKCPICRTKLRRDKFYPNGQDDNIIEILNQTEEKVGKVFDHVRDDFATLQDYNLYLDERDGIIYNLASKIDVHDQKHKIKDHKKLRERIGVTKKKKLTADQERLNKQKYIIEEFIRLRKRMSKREILTQDRLQGAVSAEACQTRGFLIEEEDFKAAQKKREVNLKNNKANQVPFPTADKRDWEPTQEAILTMGGEKATFVMPEPVFPELAKEIVKNISKGAMAELESWNKLTEIEKFKSKRASGWSEMMHFERAKEEAFGSLG